MQFVNQLNIYSLRSCCVYHSMPKRNAWQNRIKTLLCIFLYSNCNLLKGMHICAYLLISLSFFFLILRVLSFLCVCVRVYTVIKHTVGISLLLAWRFRAWCPCIIKFLNLVSSATWRIIHFYIFIQPLFFFVDLVLWGYVTKNNTSIYKIRSIKMCGHIFIYLYQVVFFFGV